MNEKEQEEVVPGIVLDAEFVDEEEKISAFQNILSQLFDDAGCGGLVTLENIRVIHYLPESSGGD